MVCYLMHKNIEVAFMEINDFGEMKKFKPMEKNREHLPIGCMLNNTKAAEWWKDRRIPGTRNCADVTLKKMGISTTGVLLVDNLALSLNDCYWIKPLGSDLAWEDVSLFSNDFIDYFGELNLGGNISENINKRSPFRSASSQGELQKKWSIAEDSRRILIKGNWGDSYQQSLNEIFASNLHRMQGCSFYTDYSLIKIGTENHDEGIGCFSYNFCSENIESISVWEVVHSERFRGADSYFYKLLELWKKHGLSEDAFYKFMDYEILTDFLVTNVDRHMNNIHILRDADTLRWIGFAPIFDTGNSMFYKNRNIDVHCVTTHSFRKHEIEMLQYIKNRNCVDFANLPSFEVFEEIYSKDPILQDDAVRTQIYDKFQAKCSIAERFSQGEDVWKTPKKYIFSINIWA